MNFFVNLHYSNVVKINGYKNSSSINQNIDISILSLAIVGENEETFYIKDINSNPIINGVEYPLNNINNPQSLEDTIDLLLLWLENTTKNNKKERANLYTYSIQELIWFSKIMKQADFPYILDYFENSCLTYLKNYINNKASSYRKEKIEEVIEVALKSLNFYSSHYFKINNVDKGASSLNDAYSCQYAYKKVKEEIPYIY